MEYKFASDYAREIGQQIQGDVDRIVRARQEAANRAREEQRYKEQQDRMARQEQKADERYADQLYGYTKTAMETPPSGVDGWAAEGLQLALDEWQRAATQHKLEPTDANTQMLQQAKAQYDNIKNVATAKFAMNSKTMNEIRSGKMTNLAGGVELAEQMWKDYSQAPEWQLGENGKLYILGEGGLQDWTQSRYADLNDVFVPQIKAEETAFSSGTWSESLFKQSYQAKKQAYTVFNEAGFGMGELDNAKLYADISNSVSDRVRTNPQMLRQMAFEQWKRDNPGVDYMTEAHQQEALTLYNPELISTAIDGESISSGKLNENGQFVFNVTDAQIDGNKSMNAEQKRGLKMWRSAVGGYHESIAQGVAGRMEPIDERNNYAIFMANQARAREAAESQAKDDTQEILGATYAILPRLDGGDNVQGYQVPVPARDNLRVDVGGYGRVNVKNIIYDKNANIIGFETFVDNSVIDAALSKAQSPEEKANVKAFFDKYRDKPVLRGNPEFERIKTSVVNDDKLAPRLQFVPAKISAYNMGINPGELSSSGISMGTLQTLQARANAAKLLEQSGMNQ